jgi:hypothetical protein
MLWLFLLLFISLLLAQVLVGCGQTSQTPASAATTAPTAADQTTQPTSSPQADSSPAPASTQNASTPADQTTPPTTLSGPTNFLLNLPFAFSEVHGVTSDDSGATTPLDAKAIKNDVTQELHHMLFVVSSNNSIKAYSQGASPVTVQMGYNANGSVSLSYTRTVDSEAGTVTILFVGTVSGNQIAVQYEQQYTPSMLINAQASDIVVAFTAPMRQVATSEIPTAPSNGTYQMTSQGGVALAWSAGQNAASYDVYRLISDQNQQFQLLTTIKGTSYTDNSAATIQHIHATKGITYAIFSVGPTGVENPGGIIVSV